MDEMSYVPRRVVHVRTIDGTREYCICLECRVHTDPTMVAWHGTLSWEYRRFKRQSRMRRKMRRGWA